MFVYVAFRSISSTVIGSTHYNQRYAFCATSAGDLVVMLLDIGAYIAKHPKVFVEHTEPYVSALLARRDIDYKSSVRSLDLSMYGLSLKLVDHDQLGFGYLSLLSTSESGKLAINDRMNELLRLGAIEYDSYISLTESISYADGLNSLARIFPDAKTTIVELADILVIRVREDMVMRPFAKASGYRVLASSGLEHEDGSNMVFSKDGISIWPGSNNWNAGYLGADGTCHNPTSFDTAKSAFSFVEKELSMVPESVSSAQSANVHPILGIVPDLSQKPY